MIFKKQDRYPLGQVILDDLFSANKTLMLLLLAIVINAMANIWITTKTRYLVNMKGELETQQQYLQQEALNLQLEERVWADSTRVELLARKLKMKPSHSDRKSVV